MMDAIWVFDGAKSQFPGGVFTSRELAEEWIAKHALTGTLTLYPINVGVYEWAIEKGFFNPKEDKHQTSEFIGRFSSTYQEHYHYEDGKE
jgi:hypothetical protein